MWFYVGIIFIVAAIVGVIGSIEPALNRYKTTARARFGAVLYSVLAIICFIGLSAENRSGKNNNTTKANHSVLHNSAAIMPKQVHDA